MNDIMNLCFDEEPAEDRNAEGCETETYSSEADHSNEGESATEELCSARRRNFWNGGRFLFIEGVVDDIEEIFVGILRNR